MKTLLLMALLANASVCQCAAEMPSAECDLAPACDCPCEADGSGLLGYGLIRTSDHDFDCFISPISNPVFFEDPRTLTEARLIFAHHKLPGVLGGGDLDEVALQVRAALTDRLSLVAAKDGFVFAGSDAPLDDGWNDIALGLKYNLYKDPDLQQIISAGVSFEMPVGSTRTLQGNGDGELLMYLTGGTQLGDYSHWISTGGWRLPVDGREESESIYWSNHVDTLLWWPGVYALAETNWYHWTASGDAGIPGIAGLDLFNFGSTNVAGNDVITGALGLKYKPDGNHEFGIAWEIPMTGREDVMDNRLYVDAILRY